MADLILPRRRFLAGIGALIAGPAIVRVDSLMKLPPRVKPIIIGIDLAKPNSDATIIGCGTIRIDPISNDIKLGDMLSGGGLDGWRVIAIGNDHVSIARTGL